jgi:hypothetical protein
MLMSMLMYLRVRMCDGYASADKPSEYAVNYAEWLIFNVQADYADADDIRVC